LALKGKPVERLSRLFLVSTFFITNSGCSVTLIEKATYHDPPLVNIHGAYFKGNEVVVDYELAGRILDEKNSVRYQRYWAKLSYSENSGNAPKQYKIHREMLDPSLVAGWERVNVRDISKEIVAGADGNPSQSDYLNYVNTIPDVDLPIVVFLLSKDPTCPVPFISQHFFSVVTVNPETHKRFILNDQPRTDYIPTKSIPKIVIQMPFALIFDFTLGMLCAYAHCEW
jgi:hypothetical protein